MVSWDALRRRSCVQGRSMRSGCCVRTQREEPENDQRCPGHRCFQDHTRHQLAGRRETAPRRFANSPDGWRKLIAWLTEHKIRQVHACLEATGHYSLGIALALHEAGHIVSLVNPAQIRDFARTKLGRNKTDQVDVAHIREYAELFK